MPAVASSCATASSYWLRAGCGTAPACAAARVSASCRLTRHCSGGTETSTANKTTAGPQHRRRRHNVTKHQTAPLTVPHVKGFLRSGFCFCLSDFLCFVRMFGGGQCARCFQPIPASDLVMRSGELTFHPHCFSCQVSVSTETFTQFAPKISIYNKHMGEVFFSNTYLML